MNNEDAFKKWLNKNNYNASTKSNYSIYLRKHIPDILKTNGESNQNFFKTNDIKVIKNTIYLFEENTNLSKYNIDKSRFPVSALKKYEEFLINTNIVKKKENNMIIKNIMLYGAPGVGKTHNYKKLISMIEEGKTEQDIFKSISDNKNVSNEYDEIFQNIKDDKRIELVTFHQSYSYEDFIEGFRPTENGNIELEDGIFKLICNRAKNQIKETSFHHISFDEAFDIFRTEYIENELEKIYSVSNIEILIHEVKEKTIKVQSSNAKDHQYVKKSDLETVVQGLLDNKVEKPRDIKNLDVKKDTISLSGLYYPIAKKIIKIIQETKNIVEDTEKNFYILIDEINRGNISKIFGELITLIEEDKRDTYEVTLPYSKEKFKIPSNLYIIATMNSTDKSIATIDIALRRRFTFLKMEPNLDLVENSDANKLMSVLNKYIEKTIGEDYKLGHSYFMKVQDNDDLEFVKEYKIKPLLEEYFYGDEKTPETIIENAFKEYKKQEKIIDSSTVTVEDNIS